MGNIGKIQYKKAMDLFENNNYDESVRCFIKAYDEGFMQEDILQNLYNCFITPNEHEFKQTYNACGIDTLDVTYENTILDFLPVTESKYYIFNRKTRKFSGILNMEEVQERKISADSILVTDYVNIELVIAAMQENLWSGIYFILDKQAEIWLSFLKIPKFYERYMKGANVKVFDDTNHLEEYFKKNQDVWLPRRIFASDEKFYKDIVEEIHRFRINDINENRKNILLSICIPTYSRGMLALEAVNNILKSQYDSEIEIVVSNNGSENSEGYDKIKYMKDARVRYYEFSENQGFAKNVINVLEKAKGKFAVLSSDEDLLINEALPDFLDLLVEHSDTAILGSDGYGPNFLDSDEDKLFDIGFDSTSVSINRNYITGLTYNKKFIEKNEVLSRYERYKNINFVVHYTHCALAAMAVEGSYAFLSRIKLWKAYEYIHGEEDNGKILCYMTPESRLEQQLSAIEFITKALRLDEFDILSMIMERILNTFRLLHVGFYCLKEEFYKQYDWIESCFFLYKNDVKILNDLFCNEIEGDDAKEKIMEFVKNYFIEYLRKNPIEELQSEKEKFIFNSTVDTIEHQLMQGVNVDSLDIQSIRKNISESL